jgi:hypothetical protein
LLEQRQVRFGQGAVREVGFPGEVGSEYHPREADGQQHKADDPSLPTVLKAIVPAVVEDYFIGDYKWVVWHVTFRFVPKF